MTPRIPVIAPVPVAPPPWDYRVHVCLECIGAAKGLEDVGSLQRAECVSCERSREGYRITTFDAKRVVPSWREIKWAGPYAVCSSCGTMYLGVAGRYLMCGCQKPHVKNEVQFAGVMRRVG